MKELLKKWRATVAVGLIGAVSVYGALQVTRESEARQRESKRDDLETCRAQNEARDGVLIALDAMEEVVIAATTPGTGLPVQFSVPQTADQELKDLVAQVNAALAGSSDEGDGQSSFREQAIEQINKARGQLVERDCDAI